MREEVDHVLRHSYLVGAFLVRRLPACHANIRKRLVKSPRIGPSRRILVTRTNCPAGDDVRATGNLGTLTDVLASLASR
jgi:predicted AAA+ superfamily ATPase